MTHPTNPACQHTRTRLIAKDDDSQYVECLDCGEILETGELKDTTNFGESLSDA
jgi:hypothetical protein